MTENTFSGQGRLYRILFRLLTPPARGTAVAVFASPSVRVVRCSGQGDAEAFIRPAPYVVSSFGEAFLVAPESFALSPGERLGVFREGRPVAHAMVAETLS